MKDRILNQLGLAGPQKLLSVDGVAEEVVEE